MRTLALLLATALAAPSAGAAGLTNPSFESGLAGWTTNATGNVQTIDPGVNTWGAPDFTATDGSWLALLSTSPDRSIQGSGNGVDSGVDRDGSSIPPGQGTTELDIATLSQTFTMGSSFSLSLDWSVATSEFDLAGGFTTANAADVAEIRLLPAGGAPPIPLKQVSLDDGYNDGSFTPLHAADFSGATHRWGTTAGSPPSSAFADGTYNSGFQTANSGPLEPGTYTLEFFVGDELDGATDTGLLVDNIQVTAAAVPEPASAALLLSLLPAVALRRRWR